MSSNIQVGIFENMSDFGYAELFPEKSRNPHPEIKSSVPVEKVILSHFYTSVGREFCVPNVYHEKSHYHFVGVSPRF